MTSKPNHRPTLRTLVVASACLAGLLGARTAKALDVRIGVVVDVTPAGQNVPRPTPDRPAYYLPIPGGYKELGGVIRRKVAPPPPEAEVEDIFTRVLAQQGYLRATMQNPPSLILTYTWGSMVPILVGRGKATIVANEPQVLSILAGDKVDASHTDHPAPWLAEVFINERRPLRFLAISAFDFQAWQAHKTVLLWQAHVSTPGRTLAAIMPTLIEAAAPALGVETKHPVFSTTAYVPPGSVVVGIAKEKSP